MKTTEIELIKPTMGCQSIIGFFIYLLYPFDVLLEFLPGRYSRTLLPTIQSDLSKKRHLLLQFSDNAFAMEFRSAEIKFHGLGS